MAKIRESRRIERAGVNSLRALLEDHELIVQEIDGGNDHGEDLLVFLTRDGRRTGHVVAIQVKSGRKYRRANGYAVPVDDHYEDWKEFRVPVLGVVYDPGLAGLFWVNLSEVLNAADTPPTWVQIPRTSILSSSTIHGWIAGIERYIDSAGMRRGYTLATLPSGENHKPNLPIGMSRIEREHFLLSAAANAENVSDIVEQCLRELVNGAYRPHPNEALAAQPRSEGWVATVLNVRVDGHLKARAHRLLQEAVFVEGLGWNPRSIAFLARLYLHQRFPMAEDGG
ncbi:DUF4365 domain-containing protein [Streptomyces nigrescens]